MFYSLGCAFGWAADRLHEMGEGDDRAAGHRAWQFLVGVVFIAAGTFVFEGYPHLWPLPDKTILAILFVGLFGVGLAHFMWWSIVGRLPTITASLGSLLVPVIGVSASAIHARRTADRA